VLFYCINNHVCGKNESKTTPRELQQKNSIRLVGASFAGRWRGLQTPLALGNVAKWLPAERKLSALIAIF
jgi:hypothetical protein